MCMIKLSSLLSEQQGLEQVHYRLTDPAKAELVSDIDKLNAGLIRPLRRGFNNSVRYVACVAQARSWRSTFGVNNSPGAARILELLKVDRPVFCDWGIRPVFGHDHFVVPIGSFRIYQSNVVLDLATYGKPDKYLETSATARHSDGFYSAEQMEQRAVEGAESYDVKTNQLDYLEGGRTSEIILDCFQQNKYWLINVREWANALRTSEAKLKQTVVDYDSLKQAILTTPTVPIGKYNQHGS